ncbi:MAG TPA: DinB family protein [Terriglobales bacterium]|nr:DinB family protein [Terriglobales bacterium]
MAQTANTYDFLLDSYETEILKTTGIWLAFPVQNMEWRPHQKSRTVLEQFEHQLQSEARWMTTMLGIETGEPLPDRRTRDAFIDKYRSDAQHRLSILRGKPEEWWREETIFFDVRRSRAWIMLRRIAHSAHHRGQLIIYLRMLNLFVPSVYGPTADTKGKVVYNIAA